MRRLLVTTPIFYVNGPPHIGHASSMVLADAHARWLRQMGESVIFSTGTDEHGSKIEQAAGGNNVQQFCDEISGKFRGLAEALDLSHTHFIRTTDELHRTTVGHLWGKLAPLMRRGRYEGFYSQPDEMFVPLGRTRLHADGKTRLSAESGHVLQWLQEDTYEFPLNKFDRELRNWASQPDSILPQERQAEVLHQMMSDEALAIPLSVSRASSRSSWGIPVPGDSSSTIYVWLDALANYLTVAGYDGTLESVQNVWPPFTQIIGKDILRFHSVYWPAFLLGAGLKPPQRLVCHGHWTVEGQKMSKSLGNVVDPWLLLDEFGVDAVRFFLLSEMNLASDSNFSHHEMRQRIFADMANSLGNLIKRCTAASLNPNRCIPARPSTSNLDEAARVLLQRAEALPDLCIGYMEELDFRSLVTCCMDLTRATNKYWDDVKPWTLRSEPNRLEQVLALTLEIVRILMTALQSVTPRASNEVLTRLGVPSVRRSVLDMRLWQVDLAGHSLSGFDGHLFLDKNKNSRRSG